MGLYENINHFQSVKYDTRTSECLKTAHGNQAFLLNLHIPEMFLQLYRKCCLSKHQEKAKHSESMAGQSR